MLDVLTVRLISLSKPVDPNMSKKYFKPSRTQNYKVYTNPVLLNYFHIDNTDESIKLRIEQWMKEKRRIPL